MKTLSRKHTLGAITAKWRRAAASAGVSGESIFPRGAGTATEKWGRVRSAHRREGKQDENSTTPSHLGFSLLCTKRTLCSFTSVQLKWPALSSWTSCPSLDSTSCPLVGALTTRNWRSSSRPPPSRTFRRGRSSGFIEPMGRVREPFTWRVGGDILPGKHTVQRSDLIHSLIRLWVFFFF